MRCRITQAPQVTRLEQVPHDDGVRDDNEGLRPERQLVHAAAVDEPASADTCRIELLLALHTWL